MPSKELIPPVIRKSVPYFNVLLINLNLSTLLYRPLMISLAFLVRFFSSYISSRIVPNIAVFASS